MKQNKISGILLTILLTVVTAVFIGAFTWLYVSIPFWPLQLCFVLLGMGLLGVLIYVCIRRIREIKKEDPDDISKY